MARHTIHPRKKIGIFSTTIIHMKAQSKGRDGTRDHGFATGCYRCVVAASSVVM